MMRLTGRSRVMIAIVAGLALIAVTVMAARDVGPRMHGSSVAERSDCSGQCAGCPLAGTERCPAVKRGADAEECATVIADRCIGCVKCVRVAPEAYRMNPDTNKAEIIPGAPAEAIARGARACPVNAVRR